MYQESPHDAALTDPQFSLHQVFSSTSTNLAQPPPLYKNTTAAAQKPTFVIASSTLYVSIAQPADIWICASMCRRLCVPSKT
jgi:hypothetical protein